MIIVPKDPSLISTSEKPFRLEVKRLSEVESRQIDWFWYPYVPAGTLSLLFGQGGIGKSYITCAIAAAVSKGEPLPGQKTALPPQKILMVSAEDDAGYILKPRMEALGANMNNIFTSDTSFTLDKRGIAGLEAAMRSVSATVVFLDPLVSYLGGKMDINKSNESRAMMGPLNEAAKRTGSAVIVVHHVRKDSKGGMMNQALGSVDFGNSVRSAMLAQKTKGGNKILIHVKHNWSSQGPTLAFSTEDDTFEWNGIYGGGDEDEENIVSKRPRAQARQFLQDTLRDGPVPSIEIFRRGAQYGLTAPTLNRAKQRFAHSRHVNGVWCWELNSREGLGDALVVAPLTEAELPTPAEPDAPGDMSETLAHARAILEKKNA